MISRPSLSWLDKICYICQSIKLHWHSFNCLPIATVYILIARKIRSSSHSLPWQDKNWSICQSGVDRKSVSQIDKSSWNSGSCYLDFPLICQGATNALDKCMYFHFFFGCLIRNAGLHSIIVFSLCWKPLYTSFSISALKAVRAIQFCQNWKYTLPNMHVI